VYENAAGFLRIRALPDQIEHATLFDNTRIHPECYIANDWLADLRLILRLSVMCMLNQLLPGVGIQKH
jgi:transcriptional accessory protein Tex/SPT6